MYHIVEVIDAITPEEVPIKNSHHIPATNQNQLSQHSNKSEEKLQTQNVITDELSKDEKELVRLKNEEKKCEKCSRCTELENKIDKLDEERKKIEFELRLAQREVEEAKIEQKARKNSTVDKTEMNFQVTSLQEIIESYKDERKKISKLLLETMNTSTEDSNKTLYQLIENLTTDFISNWCEINRELSDILKICSGKEEEECEKSTAFNFYLTMDRIGQIKECVVGYKNRIY